MQARKVYQLLAHLVAWEPTEAYKQQRMDELKEALDLLPSGSGWDCGTTLDEDKSTPQKLVLYGEFHHMNDGGYYDGWTSHQIIVTPHLAQGFQLRITGRNRNDIKDYLYEMFDAALREDEPLENVAKVS